MEAPGPGLEDVLISQPLTKGLAASRGNGPRRKLIASREDEVPHHAHVAIPSHHGSQGVQWSQSTRVRLIYKTH